MKKIQAFALILAFMVMGYTSTLHAEDVDIYVDNAGTTGVPNVLFVMDNGADFSADAKIPCNFYTGTTEVPSLGGKAAGVEQCALVDVINSLEDSKVNIGILTSNGNNFATDVRNTSDDAYHEICSTDVGGCLLRKLTLMDAAGKASLVKFIKSWKMDNSANSATGFGIKVNTATPATMMQEAWAYYRGKVGMSGKSYATDIVGSGCQKNFIIFIANGQSSPASETTPSPFDGTNALTSVQVAATADQKIKITDTIKFSPATCGATSVVASTNTNNWSVNWADEWARLAYQQDGGAVDAEDKQNIISYTVAVVNETINPTCTPDYPALMTSMANVGGGKFFKTSTAADIKAALSKILNEVQAVNSVFSSASLPVSVNSEGTYLNQIYLGMFRPDRSGSPRWLGNLKQYQAIRVGTNIVMGDSTGAEAISSAGTGFISPNAISFWTKQNLATAPDDAGGFWKNDKKGEPLSGFDKPDGEVVEKGGVAQQLRLESLTSTFDGAGGTTVNPRRVYTFCPSGTCTFALTDSSNEFSTANAGIGAGAFGSSTTVPIVSIVRTGTSALVTTNGNHGFSTGTIVTISNASQNEYNVTQAVTVNSVTTFTIAGLPDYPTTPSAGTYTIRNEGLAPTSITSIVRATSTSGNKNFEAATVTTSAAHGFTTTSTVVITNANDTVYNANWTPTAVTATTFEINVPIYPTATAVNTYKAKFPPTAYPAKTVTITKLSSTSFKGDLAAHGFWVGQTVIISGSTESKYNDTFTIATVPDVNSFTINKSGLTSAATSSSGSIVVDFTSKTLGSVTRAATTSPATAVVTGAPALFFGSETAPTSTRTLNISRNTGTNANEGAYEAGDVTITCLDASCTSFSYPILVTPSVTQSSTSMVAALPGSTSVSIPAGGISRASSGNIATVSGVTANVFASGQNVVITASGTALSNESAYVGTWPITCTAPCTEFTFGPVTLTPASPATGSNMQAFSSSSPPDRDTIIKWLRGADNYGDEKGPGGTVTVRPSIHGDVLHSRPLVVNYGDSRGIAVFYGSNDGLFRAVNGNQTAAIGSVPAGGELWSLILPDHYGAINRQRLASPELKFPASTLSSAQPKDYFIDGPTGAYQKLTPTGTIDKAYIYLTMRRGGRFLYAVDVSTPTAPVVLWKKDVTSTGFEELGQTWSRPRVTLLETDAAASSPTPVLIFGAGYDTAQDAEPPGTDTMGRGIYVVNALNGNLIWSATKSCTTSATCLNVADMKYAIPSEIAFVDRNYNGYTDKMYFGDLGGNVWRVDVKTATSNWAVTKLAALGCATGACSAGTTPRKFFFPPSVLTVREGAGSFDAISIVSGDREHPLKSTATGSSYNVADRFFMLMDRGTTVGGTGTTGITADPMFNATSTQYIDDGANSGFYISFATGEKGVNAPLAVNGNIFFATNRPVDRTATCAANLGQAKAYAVSPFLGSSTSNILSGGGLPPSAVSGLITLTNPDGTTSTEKFCIGCGVTTPPDAAPDTPAAAPCDSALQICTPNTVIPKQMRRTYWYKK
jgi:Tfp pilus tip-associated adhesin PilY1